MRAATPGPIWSMLCLLGLAPAVWAADPTQLPGFLHDSYLGLSAGYADFGFTDTNLAPHLHATSIHKERISLKVAFGHYLNPYLALQLSLMRPLDWVQYQGVYASDRAHSVWTNILSLTVRPTWPLTAQGRLYGEIGPSYIARKGFNDPHDAVPGLSSASLVTPHTGAGVVYGLTPHWHVDANVSVDWPQHRANQPSTLSASVGLYYVFAPASTAQTSAPVVPFHFPLNVLEVGLFDRHWWNFDPTNAVANAHVFFNGSIKAQSGAYLMYERNVYHTPRWMSLDGGISVGRWVSRRKHEVFYTVAVFPAIRVWPLHSAWLDGYVTASLAGPAVLSRHVIAGMPTGGNFTFQDYLGVGVFVGHRKQLSINLKLMHYSNGNLLPHNPGVATPCILNLGYAW